MLQAHKLLIPPTYTPTLLAHIISIQKRARLPRPRRRGCSSPQAGGALTFSQQLEKVSKKS
ncbi:MAG: hypothetical protein WCU80_08535, partial [Paludibacteraceae bacterium]